MAHRRLGRGEGRDADVRVARVQDGGDARPRRGHRREGRAAGMNAKTIYIASKTIHAPKWLALRAAGWPIIATWIDEAGPGDSPDLADLSKRCIREAAHATRTILYGEPGEVL